MVELSPASRFTDASGRALFTKVERSKDGLLGRDLTWRTARGALVWLGRRCFYAPLFFWRKLR